MSQKKFSSDLYIDYSREALQIEREIGRLHDRLERVAELMKNLVDKGLVDMDYIGRCDEAGLIGEIEP